MDFLQLPTFAYATFIGVVLFIISNYLKIPTIVLLLLGGILAGPEVFGIIHPDSFGNGLRVLISVCVAIILFEGGLTLHPQGIKNTPKVIWRLLSIGVLITWIGSAFLIYIIFRLPVEICLLAGSLIIVTGPTVIAPLFKRIRIKSNLFHILHWEGVLIDPIGVFIAILCFEWVSIEGNFTIHIIQLSYRLIIGTAIGYPGGKLLAHLLKKDKIPEDKINILIFASAIFLFAISDAILHESGILTVIISGLVIGWANPPGLKHIKAFKSELTEVAIALIFILLAANLKLVNFLSLGWKIIIVIIGMMLIIRPLSIFICTFKTNTTFKEKLFLSWIAPRGVIAGSMASLFGIKLVAMNHPNSQFLETFTYCIIASTIIFQGGSARWIAKLLNVEEPERKDWLIIGAHPLSRKIADFIQSTTSANCILLDSNADHILDSNKQGYESYQGNALSLDSLSANLIAPIGNLLALTDNRDLNQLICEKWSEHIPETNLYRWSSQDQSVEKQINGKGMPIWFKYAKPSQISYDILNDEIILVNSADQKNFELDKSFNILLSCSDQKISFASQNDSAKNSQYLVYKRNSRHLKELLYLNHLFFLEPQNYKETLDLILNKIKDIYPDLPYDSIYHQLMSKENTYPTLLMEGIAAPHVHCAAIEKPLCFIAIINGSINLKTYDKKDVKLVFFLISPANQPEIHLKLLSEIARINLNKNLIQHIKDAKSAEEILYYIKTIGSEW